ncbi:MAG: PstS family phosphate ABC transporter substrate-binding protein [Nocardioides sp.]
MKSTSLRRLIVPGIASLAIVLTACGSGQGGDGATEGGDTKVSGSVAVDGSSTVFPMSQAAAELLSEENPDVRVAVGEAGTGGGFEKFCADATDVSDASRPIKEDEEAPICAEAGIEYTELLVATDALTVVVNPELDVDCLTVDQLKQLWLPDSKVSNWNQLDPAFPDQEIALFGPGTDSGTYDYMAGDVLESETEATRTDYESSEDDNVLVQGVANTQGATGYFGYTYYEENTDSLKALGIDSGAGCVEPSAETAQSGDYTPLARPLFIYVNNKKYTDNAAVKAYVDYYIDNLKTIAEAAKFIPLNDTDYAATKGALAGIGG